MRAFERSFRWRTAGVAVLLALGAWACLNPETDDFPTYELGAGGSGATAVDPGGFAGTGGSGDGAAGGPVSGYAGGSGGNGPQPPAAGNTPDAGVSDAGPGDAGGQVNDGG